MCRGSSTGSDNDVRCRATWTSYAQSANTATRRTGWLIASTSLRNTATSSLRCSPAADRCVARRRHHHTLRVNPERAQRIRDTGRSIFAFTAAALGEYLRRVHRGRDIIIGVPFLNRSSDAELRTVGCMVNMLPLRIPRRRRGVDGRTRRSDHGAGMGTAGSTAVCLR